MLIGSNTITCQSSGQWSIPRAECAVYVPGTNKPPRAILLSLSSVPENSPSRAVVGKLSTIDDDEDQAHSYTMTDSDGGLFDVDNNAATLIVVGKLDYESQSRHNIRVTSTDDGSPPLSITQDLTVYVTNVNEPPGGFNE